MPGTEVGDKNQKSKIESLSLKNLTYEGWR